MLAGPGVIDDGAIDGLRAFAAAGNLGVANTWGAKGVFAWDSPHHLGTCGLQARDFELLGFASADLIVATGLAETESPQDRYALAPVEVVEPADLVVRSGEFVSVVESWPNELHPRLAAIAMPGYVDEKVPLHPSRASRELGIVLPATGVVIAEPGIAGLWVARTFPTPALAASELRRVVVPAVREPGVAMRGALTAARAGRPAIAVTTGPIDDATARAFEEAERDRVSVILVVWTEHGSLRDVDEHRQRLGDALEALTPMLLEVPVALDDTALLVDAAGEVVAWGGLG